MSALRGRPVPARGASKNPALAAWRSELAAGKRAAWTFDPLWRAACAEMAALEFEADRLPRLAESCRRQAERIVRAAARGMVV